MNKHKSLDIKTACMDQSIDKYQDESMKSNSELEEPVANIDQFIIPKNQKSYKKKRVAKISSKGQKKQFVNHNQSEKHASLPSSIEISL